MLFRTALSFTLLLVCMCDARQRLGLVTGIGIGNISQNEFGEYGDLNLAAELGLDYQIWVIKDMSINTGIVYAKFHEKDTDASENVLDFYGESKDGITEYKERINVENIEIPLYLKINEERFKPFLGIDASYNINQSISKTIDTNGVRRSQYDSNNLRMKKINLYGIAGCAFELSRSLEIQIKYTRGLLKIRKFDSAYETLIGERLILLINWELIYKK